MNLIHDKLKFLTHPQNPGLDHPVFVLRKQIHLSSLERIFWICHYLLWSLLCAESVLLKPQQKNQQRDDNARMTNTIPIFITTITNIIIMITLSLNVLSVISSLGNSLAIVSLKTCSFKPTSSSVNATPASWKVWGWFSSLPNSTNINFYDLAFVFVFNEKPSEIKCMLFVLNF